MSDKLCINASPLPASEIIDILERGGPALEDYLGTNIYANASPAYLEKQRCRLAETVGFHRQRVGDKPTYLLRAPGRLNAFLEYLDMCAGDHMSTTIDGDIPVAVSPRMDDILDVANVNPIFQAESLSLQQEFARFAEESLERHASGMADTWDNRTRVIPYFGRPKGNWLNYVLSSCLRIMWDNPGRDFKGASMSFGRATAPFRAGTSSSSAVVVLAFLSLCVSNREVLDNMPLMEACRLLGEAEWYVGTHGGANDQTTILCNRANNVLYNRHSRKELESTTLPFLKGIHVVLAHSLWEVNKSLGGNQSFNMRKGWMEIGDAVLRLVISSMRRAISNGEKQGPGWIASVLQRDLHFDFVPELPLLDSNPELWNAIESNYNKLGSLDESILGIPSAAISELILTLPVKITVAEAAELLGIETEMVERRFTRPRRIIGGYHTRTTARFFFKENVIGRKLEKTFLEAEARVAGGEISLDSAEYDAYRTAVGAMVDDLQHTLRFDFRVSNSQLDRLLDIARHGPGYLGSKLTGAGKGGCVSILVRETESEAMCRYLDREYYTNPANFEEYRQILQDSLRYFEDDEFERASAEERLHNLENALASIEEQRRVVTFSRGACALDLGRYR